MKRTLLFGVCILTLWSLAGCATPLPRPSAETMGFADGLSGDEIFERSLTAHGGDLRDSVVEIRTAIIGEWGALIKRIQPLVTDYRYRIDSEERFNLETASYTVRWTGPDGVKTVSRKPDAIQVDYNGEVSQDEDVLASSAMTSDAFQLFHFGPSILAWKGAAPKRLPDFKEGGKSYFQLHFLIQPGFGMSEQDEVALLIDKETWLAHRVWITLEGFRTTRGATVDVTFLEYGNLEGLTLPRRFVERVRAPISIHAHSWHVTDWSATMREE